MTAPSPSPDDKHTQEAMDDCYQAGGLRTPSDPVKARVMARDDVTLAYNLLNDLRRLRQDLVQAQKIVATRPAEIEKIERRLKEIGL